MPADDDAGGHHPRVQLEGVLALRGGPPAGAVARVEVAAAEYQRRRPIGQRRERPMSPPRRSGRPGSDTSRKGRARQGGASGRSGGTSVAGRL